LDPCRTLFRIGRSDTLSELLASEEDRESPLSSRECSRFRFVVALGKRDAMRSFISFSLLERREREKKEREREKNHKRECASVSSSKWMVVEARKKEKELLSSVL